jgi:hypothetical protein
VEPTVRLSGKNGLISIEENPGIVSVVDMVMDGDVVADLNMVVDIDADEHAPMIMVKTTINPIVRQWPINFSGFLFMIISLLFGFIFVQ